jgi:hypothetical protein
MAEDEGIIIQGLFVIHPFVEVQKTQFGSSSERFFEFCRLFRIKMGFKTFPQSDIETMPVR